MCAKLSQSVGGRALGEVVTESKSWRISPRLWTKRFGVFALGATISEFGDQIAAATLALAIYAATQNLGVVAAVWMIRAGMRIVVEPLAGWCADLWPKRDILVGATLCTAFFFLLIGFWYESHPMRVLVVLGLVQLANSIFAPASHGVMPELVDRSELLRANAVFKGLMQLSRVTGPAVGVWIYSLHGAEWLFYGNAVSFVVFAAALMLLPRIPVEAVGSKAATTPRQSLRASWHAILVHPFFGMLLVASVVGSGAWRVFEIGIVEVVHDDPRFTVKAYGVALSALVVGSMAGAGLAFVAQERLKALQPRPVFLVLAPCCLVLLWLWPGSTALVVALFCAGVVMEVSNVHLQTSLQSDPPAGRVGFAFGVLGSSTAVGAFVVAGVVAFLPAGWASVPALASIGLCALLFYLVVASFARLAHRTVCNRATGKG